MLEGEEVQVAVDPYKLPFVEHGLSEVEWQSSVKDRKAHSGIKKLQ